MPLQLWPEILEPETTQNENPESLPGCLAPVSTIFSWGASKECLQDFLAVE
jgi:hypothetical protein